MAPSIAPELRREFTAAALAACPPGQTTNNETLRALLERQDLPPPGDHSEMEERLRARLEQDPTDLETLCALDCLHADHTTLKEVLQRRYELAVDLDDAWKLQVRLGLLHIVTGSEDGLRTVIATLAPLRSEQMS
jgi:hypothetical protein